MSPAPSSIWVSKANMESMLISGPMLVSPTTSAAVKCVEVRSLTSRTMVARNPESPVAHRCGDGTTFELGLRWIVVAK